MGDKVSSYKFKVLILWVGIFLAGVFLLGIYYSSSPVTLTVLPEAPKEGDPVIALFSLNNPLPSEQQVSYSFYCNGSKVQSGQVTLAAFSGTKYQYTSKNNLKVGEQQNYAVRMHTSFGDFEKNASVPAYPPQVFCSFMSFASFSTSVMSFMTSAPYYDTTFAANEGLNVGLFCSLVLIALLIFLELTEPLIAADGGRLSLLKLRVRFSTVTWILFTIFLGIVFTKVTMILAA
ncbi:MAG: hypothetical protein FH756_07420 [Firmicutes bacterium]|nr:hypothetical protein [Bacillota bacterium]